MRHVLRLLNQILTGLGLVILAYILAGIGGSIIPRNDAWVEPKQGITIFVHDNGIHTGLLLPRQNAIADWSDLVRPEHLSDPRYYGDYLLFGWGDRSLYLETPTWFDLRPRTALAALFGSDASLVHVDHVFAPQAADELRPILVTEEEYDRVATAIRTQFALDSSGASQPVGNYGAADVFYAAKDRYSAFKTCNEWTGSILRDAGIRVGIWTPFSFGVMRWF